MNSSDKKSKHPNLKQLSDFINGDLPARHQTKMEQHLESCDQCIEHLGTIGGDTLGERLLEVGTYYDDSSDGQDENEIPESLLNHDRYELIERIGVGGMGDVFRAQQRSMDRPVAIKVLRMSLFKNDRAVARFHNEIKVAARLNHPNIVHSYDADVSQGLNILVMELVEGDKLSDIVDRNGSLAAEQVIGVATQIANGLGYAAEQGMIHRDIKPQNIMVLPDGKVKITDFGLAKFVTAKTEEPDSSLTLAGEVFGTPDYIAPEQIRDSGAADSRSDIYGLGCTMYFMLTGRPPFIEPSVGEKLAGHLERQAAPLVQLAQGLNPSLIDVVEKMMQKEPDMRFQSYDEIVKALSASWNQQGEASVFATANLSDDKSSTDAIKAGVSAIETALDLETAKTSANRLPTRKKRDRRKLIAVASGGAILLGALLISGVIPSPISFFSSGNNRTGKISFAIVVPSTHAYYPEIQELYNNLKKHDDIEFEFIAEKIGRVRFNRRMPGPGPEQINVVRTLKEIETSEFDAVIFTGGWDGDSPESTRYAFDEELNLQAKRFIESMIADGKPVGSICGGTVVLANAGVIRGKNTANCNYISDEIKSNSGAIWTELLQKDNQAVTVRDGLIVTGGNSINSPEIARVMLQLARESRN